MSTEIRIQAQYIVVDPMTILHHAQLVICDGVIQEVCESTSRSPDINLPDQTILPGFINAHTHLEFSDLAEPIPAGRSFPDWIAAVVKHRIHQAANREPSQLDKARARAIVAGLAESQSLGSAAIVDIVTAPWAVDEIRRQWENRFDHASPSLIALPELLGYTSERFNSSKQWAIETLSANATQSDLAAPILEIGLSPHATYSLMHPEAVVFASTIDRRKIVAMHVAETREERQWLEQGTGPFRDLYQSLGLPLDAQRMSIRDAIELLAKFDRSLLIHGNYLTDAELDRIAASKIAIVYCPRTHAHFGHSAYPLQQILDRQIPLLLGTDSRASNPDLSIWRECCRALQQHPQWTAEKAFSAITLSAAETLQIAQYFGSLRPQRHAHLNRVKTPDRATEATLLDRLLRQSNQHPAPVIQSQSRA